MKIFIDIGHPAHVHYFKNFISELKQNGHEFLITARNKEVTHELLNAYNFDYVDRGRGKKSTLGKLFYLFKTNFKLLRLNKKFDADIFLSFASPYVAQTAWLTNTPYIAIDDTEHNKVERWLYLVFSFAIITPSSYELNLGRKHKKINSYTELLYLHPKYYHPNHPYSILNIDESIKYVVLRFVAWNAYHDRGHSGIDISQKKVLITFFEKKGYRVFISDENQTEDEYANYQLDISPERIHDVIKYSSLLVTEGATMASEGVILGTSTIYVNSLNNGYLKEQSSKYGLVNLRNSKELFREIEQLLNTKFEEQAKKNSIKLIKDKEDFTSFLIEYINSGAFKENNGSHKKQFLFNSKFKNWRGCFIGLYLGSLIILYISPFGESFSLSKFNIGYFRADHLIHFIIFLPIPLIVNTLINKKDSLTSTILLSLLLASGFEIIHFFLPYRSFTLVDLISNLIGVFLGFLILFTIEQKKK